MGTVSISHLEGLKLTTCACSLCLLVRKVRQKLLGFVHARSRIKLLRSICYHHGMHVKTEKQGAHSEQCPDHLAELS